MWYEIGMKYIDGLPYYPVFDTIIVVICALVLVTCMLMFKCREQKEKIDELQNLVDYYYYETLNE